MKRGGSKERDMLLNLVREGGYACGVVDGMKRGQSLGVVLGFFIGTSVSWTFYQIWKGAGVWW